MFAKSEVKNKAKTKTLPNFHLLTAPPCYQYHPVESIRERVSVYVSVYVFVGYIAGVPERWGNLTKRSLDEHRIPCTGSSKQTGTSHATAFLGQSSPGTNLAHVRLDELLDLGRIDFPRTAVANLQLNRTVRYSASFLFRIEENWKWF